MVMLAVKQRLTALREPSRAARLAAGLWIAWAVVVWNLVFDRVIIVAGRAYVQAAVLVAKGSGPYARIDDWMRPAIPRALTFATVAGAAILIVGFVAIRAAVRVPERVTS